MTPDSGNIHAGLPDAGRGEVFEELLSRGGVRIERIVSRGQATATGEWYDQGWDEWVLLLSGSAGVLIDGEKTPRTLQAGDYLLLPAGCRHRVEWTEQTGDTVWLAIHIDLPANE